MSAAKEIWKCTAHWKGGLSSAKKCFCSLKNFFSFFFSGSENKTNQQKRTVGTWWVLGHLQNSGSLTRCWMFDRKASSPFLPADSALLFLSVFLLEPMLTCCFLSVWAFFSRKAWPCDGCLGFCFLVWYAARSQVEECKSDLHEWGKHEWKVEGRGCSRSSPSRVRRPARGRQPCLPVRISWES